jgi:3-methyladenine DNA glycosylase AlkD
MAYILTSQYAMPSTPARVRDTLTWLKRRGSARNRDGMARYGIVADKIFGVSVGDLRAHAKKLGRSHALAAALWKTGWYEARMLATMVDEPERVTPAQMDRWCRDFDNWAICDTACFGFFDRVPHAWGRIAPWARRRREFEKRAAFALLASVAAHDKAAPDSEFLKHLPHIQRAADDDRNFVKKGVSWALRGIGHRNATLHTAAIRTARRLTLSPNASARWVGRDALRDLLRPLVVRRVRTKR